MSVVLKLPKKLERELASEAQAESKTLSKYLVELIQRSRGGHASPFKNTSDILAYWKSEGLIGTRPANTDSQKLARKLRKQAETRRRS